MKNIIALVLIGILFSNYIILESDAKISIKKSDESRCTNIHAKFLAMGEDGFRKRYPSYPIIDKCVNLFNSFEWNFNGKESIGKKISKITQSQNDSAETNPILNSKIISKTKIGTEKYLIKFNICSENKNSNHLQIVTDKEQIIGKIYRPITETCPLFLVQINSKIPENTEVSWHYGTLEKSQTIREVLLHAKK